MVKRKQQQALSLELTGKQSVVMWNFVIRRQTISLNPNSGLQFSHFSTQTNAFANPNPFPGGPYSTNLAIFALSLRYYPKIPFVNRSLSRKLDKKKFNDIKMKY